MRWAMINELNRLPHPKRKTRTMVDETTEMNFSIGFFTNKMEVTRQIYIQI